VFDPPVTNGVGVPAFFLPFWFSGILYVFPSTFPPDTSSPSISFVLSPLPKDLEYSLVFLRCLGPGLFLGIETLFPELFLYHFRMIVPLELEILNAICRNSSPP